ncbi:hypothetical protein LCGC14_0381700 [marine sediment metagenome]|uniref:DNA-directed DNA polymerase n=1 Tax=marine sediment metagenome TaxID=412755 RepID=A0A0F9WB11_9ZZZZ
MVGTLYLQISKTRKEDLVVTVSQEAGTVLLKYPGSKCNECPLQGNKFVPPEIPDKPYKILFLGQAPANTEVRLGRPLVGDSGLLFNSALEEHEISREDVGVDNALLCQWYSRDGEKPPREALEACSGHIDINTPEVLVPMGNEALGVLTGRWDGILSIAGTTVPNEIGKKVVPVAHPAYYLRSNSNNFRDFKDNIWLIKQLSEGKNWDHVASRMTVYETREEAIEFFHWLRDNPPEKLSVDLETDSVDIAGAKITSLGLAWEEDYGVIIPWSQEYQDMHNTGIDGLLEYEDVYQACKEALEVQTGVIAWNAPFDICILRREDIDVKLKSCVLMKHYSMDERNVAGAQSLKRNASTFLGIPNWEIGLKKYLKKKLDPYTLVPPSTLFWYQTFDTTTTLALDNIFDMLLALPENEGPSRLYHERIANWVRMFVEVLPVGARMDLEKLREAMMVMPAKREALVKEMQEITGIPLYNPNSYLDNRKALFEVFKLPKIKGLSTDKDVMAALLESTGEGTVEHEFVELLIEFKQYQKVVGTYLVNLARSYRGGFGYADLKLFGTVTGRLSANNFNPLVFPRESRDEDRIKAGKGSLYGIVKEIIIPDEDSFFIQADYSGMELRIQAVLSQDPYMLEVLADPKSDWHATMAQEMYGAKFLDANEGGRKELRVIAKMLVFGLNYGRGVPSIAGQLGCSNASCARCPRNMKCARAIKEAQALVDSYFAPIPRLKQYREETVEITKSQGYLEVPSGRRRRYDLITRDNWKSIEKQIYNFPMQSTGNDCNLDAMYEAWTKYGTWVRPLWPIHDAVLWNIRKNISIETLDAFLTTLQEVPSRSLNTSLPFYVDVDAGDRWGQLKKMEWKGPGTTKDNVLLRELVSA